MVRVLVFIAMSFLIGHGTRLLKCLINDASTDGDYHSQLLLILLQVSDLLRKHVHETALQRVFFHDFLGIANDSVFGVLLAEVLKQDLTPNQTMDYFSGIASDGAELVGLCLNFLHTGIALRDVRKVHLALSIESIGSSIKHGHSGIEAHFIHMSPSVNIVQGHDHCIELLEKGNGKSVFKDGFLVAEDLKETVVVPDHFAQDLCLALIDVFLPKVELSAEVGEFNSV